MTFSRYGQTLTERKNKFSKEVQRYLSEPGVNEIWMIDEGVMIVKELLENVDNPNRVNINAKDEYNLTPLHHAALR